ncbi:BREX system P-loop protein BrxC [Candidatus Saccharibacteria bacterium]|nr:BREX system P-loop protein BrxC [Candidatus Saccharibacteria bacterium]
MKISSLYKKDIKREIQGVIKVDDEHFIAQELDEYVVTEEIAKHLDTFFEAYSKGLGTSRTEQMGVWLSGFFGSGKSHFLKIVSYLIDNREVGGKRAVDYFDEKINDAMLLGNIKRAGDTSSDVILFNIDTKSSIENTTTKDKILAVLEKVFNEKIGYSHINFVADIERFLEEQGKYDEFKAKFDNWQEVRSDFDFRQNEIAEKYAEVMGCSVDEANKLFDNRRDNYEVSAESFAERVQNYIEKRGNDHHVLFLIDEVGQYIGNDTQLLLNLQSIVEELGVRTNGRAWVICSSQEAIDDVVKGVKKNDFSKILGRFDTKIKLSSTDADEVIKKRLLAKTDDGTSTLAATYNNKEAEIKNLLTFGEGGTYKVIYRDAKDFAATYPYIPYQFKLLQDTYMNIREKGFAGAHLSSGERSLLGAIQETAKSHADDEIGALVPFSAFYETVVTAIDSSIIRIFDQVDDMVRDGALEPEDKETLKTLFLLRSAQETMPTNLDNLAVLAVSNISDNILDIKNKLAASLKRLEDKILIQKLGDNYRFLTDEEQEINREIKNQTFDPNDISSTLGEVLRGMIDTKFKYSNGRIFSLNIFMDENKINGGNNELSLKFTSADQSNVQSESMRENNTAFVHTQLSSDIRADIETAVKIEKYIRQQAGVKNDTEREKIISARRTEMEGLKDKIKSDFSDIIKSAQVFVNGTQVDIPTREDVRTRRELILAELVKSVYSKIEYIQAPLNRSSIKRMLTLPKMELEVASANAKAEDAINEYIIEQARNHVPVTIDSAVHHFTAAPYGFTDEDVAYIIAYLMKKELVSLVHNGTTLAPTGDTADILLKQVNDSRVTVKVRERIDDELLNTIRALAQDVFDTNNLGSSEDEIYESLKTVIEEKFEKLSTYIEKYNYQNYPGKHAVESANSLLRELKQIRDTKVLYDTLDAKQSELKAAFDALKPVESFFDNQVSIFDRATTAVKDYDNISLSTSVKAPNINVIRDILSSEEPYNDIPKLPSLTSELEQAVANARKTLEERAAEARKLEEERQKAEEERRKAEAEGKQPAESPKVAKPVRSGDLISKTYSLKSEADIDAMLAELREQLLKELSDNGEIKVI